MMAVDELLNLSMDDVRVLSLKLAEQITEKPDLVVFVAKGSFMIGQIISDYFDVPLLEAKAARNGNNLKDIAKPILKLLPPKIKLWLRRTEIKSNYHDQNIQRSVEISDPNCLCKRSFCSILLVDDSVDTGNTILSVKDALTDKFPQARINIASLFVFSKSKECVTVNNFIFEDTIFSGPWSNDSKEHKEYLDSYYKMKTKGVF